MLRICTLFIRRYDKLTEEGERIDTCRIKLEVETRLRLKYMASDEGVIRLNKHDVECHIKIYSIKTGHRSVFMYILMSSLVKGTLGETKYRPVALKDWTTVNSGTNSLCREVVVA